MTAITIRPEDREEWLARRRSGIGASEAAAVLGECPYTTPRQLYARKLGLGPEVEESEAMRRGQHMEPFLAAEYRRLFPEHDLAEQQFYQHPEHPFMIATLDGVRADGVAVEFKTANRRTAMKWGEEFTDEVPETYLCQVQHQLAVSGLELAHVWVSIGGDDCQLYIVPRNEPFIEHLVHECRIFWRRVEDRDPPPVTRAEDARIHHLLYPEPNGSIRFNDEDATVAALWAHSKELRGYHEKKADEFKALLLGMIGPNEVAYLPDGKMLTRKTVTRKGYTAEVKETTYTDLRIKEERRKHGK